MKCIVCHERDAVVPDRDRQPGRLINRVCRQCHGQRLIGDLKQILKEVEKDSSIKCLVCLERETVIPEPGKPGLCRKCHTERLKEDLRVVTE